MIVQFKCKPKQAYISHLAKLKVFYQWSQHNSNLSELADETSHLHHVSLKPFQRNNICYGTIDKQNMDAYTHVAKLYVWSIYSSCKLASPQKKTTYGLIQIQTD